MKIATLFLEALFVSAMLSLSLAFAHSDVTEPEKKIDQDVRMHLEKATAVRGMQVKDTKDENLGRIEDLVIGRREGRVIYAVLGYGGSFGFGEKNIAVPLSALRIESTKGRPHEKHFVLDVAKEDLDRNPGFSNTDWPTQPDLMFLKKVVPTRDDKDQMRRTSIMIGSAARNPKAEHLGTIRDLMIDVRGERVVYAALGHGGGLITTEKLFAVPWKAIDLRSLTARLSDECFVINVALADLDSQPGFDRNSWPNQGDHSFFKTR